MEWKAYDAIDGFGEKREELRHGQKMAQYANYHRDPEKYPDGFPAIDFMNYTERPKELKEAVVEDPEILSAKILGQVFRM